MGKLGNGMDMMATLSQTLHERMDEVLHKQFGLMEFRPLQRETISQALLGRSTLAIMPTGAGKSLCYQLPAFILPDPVLVISPLIALMRDQVRSLQDRGISAAHLTSHDSAAAQHNNLELWMNGTIKILYISPERLRHPGWLNKLARMTLGLLVVDEAHCISEWGHDFRPDYRRIREFRKHVGRPPVMALTATATTVVEQDIIRQLGLEPDHPEILRSSINRENIMISVTWKASARQQREAVADALRAHADPAIVYVDSRKQVDAWAAYLSEALGTRVEGYHAGLSSEMRTRIQNDFMRKTVSIVVATTAFGMGIDRDDIRRVIHVGVPESLDGYYQEIGRAGRDGKPAQAQMILTRKDFHAREWRLERDKPQRDPLRQIIQVLDKMPLDQWKSWSFPQDNHDAWFVILAILEDLEIIVLGAKTRESLIMKKLRPMGTSVENAVYTRLLTFYQRRKDQFQRLKEFLVTSVCRRDVLLNYYGQTVSNRSAEACCDVCAGETGTDGGSEHLTDQGLWEALRKWRKETADARGVPPYLVFSDEDLWGIYQRRPVTLDALRECKGVGPIKRDRYGSAIVSLFLSFGPGVPVTSMVVRSAKQQAFGLFREGVSLNEIAERVGRSPRTVFDYLLEWIGHDDEALWKVYAERYVSGETYQKICLALNEGVTRLRELFNYFEGQYSYEVLSVARVWFEQEAT